MALFHSEDRAVFHCTYAPHLLYPSTCRWTSGCLHVLAIGSIAAVNIGVHLSLKLSFYFESFALTGIILKLSENLAPL